MKLRHFLIKQGLIKPTLKEAQSLFDFPLKTKTFKNTFTALKINQSVHQARRIR